jgi:AcrR family transcriptional regulator
VSRLSEGISYTQLELPGRPIHQRKADEDIPVTQVAQTKRDKISRRQVDKFAERRAQLADAALVTLAELGYARTSLREIAQNSEFSHGVLHYYFSDKADLITQCVRQYNAYCVTRYDQIVATAASPGELKRDFAAGLAKTLREDDVAEIDKSLERMIWRIVSQFAELAGRPLAVSPEVAYGIFDGLFQQALFKFLSGDPDAPATLTAQVEPLMDSLLLARP